MVEIETLFTPAEFNTLATRDLSRTVAVVFDILRATTSMITALANGAAAIVPVATIEEALERRAEHPKALLAGERNGVRIRAALTGSVDFDLGNSPREFTRSVVGGRTIVMTTTNGTRALRSCAHAVKVFPASFRNLTATAQAVVATRPERVLLVGSGTFEDAAFEDTLATGAMAEELSQHLGAVKLLDSTSIAREIWRAHRADLLRAMAHSRNGTRLLAMPELAADVPLCLERDAVSLVASQSSAGVVTAV
jgi:2-phosphosulfolactate phosphatase